MKKLYQLWTKTVDRGRIEPYRFIPYIIRPPCNCKRCVRAIYERASGMNDQFVYHFPPLSNS